MSIIRKWFIFCALLILGYSHVYAQDEVATRKAVATAEAFLALMDADKYDDAWETASESLRSSASKEIWRAQFSQVRMQIGTSRVRKLMDGKDAPKTVNRPEGEFLLVKYSTSFSKVPNLIESLPLKMEKDGQYHVAGYMIRPAPTAEETLAASQPPKANFTDDEIKAILRERIEIAKRGVGMVVGLIDEKGTRIISVGRPSLNSNNLVDGNSVYEIGSITKTFTSILLADMAARGEVKLDDPISKYLPKSVKTPVVNGQEITLQHLARHTSGLPRLPSNMVPRDPSNPYADYTVEQIYAFLNSYTQTRPIGVTTEYSNLGAGLLGHILALRAGTDYETLVKKRILTPLKMNSTAITLTPSMHDHMTTGHNQWAPVAYWDLPALAGAGALRSSANDMLRYLAANMGLTPSLDPVLSAAMKRTHINVESKTPNEGIGLGWTLSRIFENNVIEHGGGTGGFSTFIAFEPIRKRGVVVLSNSNTPVNDIGLHLLDSRTRLNKLVLPKAFTAIQIDSKSLDAFIGTYEIAPGNTIVISRDGTRLQATTALGTLEIFAYEPMSFFSKVLDAQLTFVKEGDAITKLLLYQEGMSFPAKKVR